MIRKQLLPNGLTVITERMPHVRSVTVGVWLRRGSRHEAARLNGISHFIEHLLFKGTASRTAREIALSMDSIGGQLDAFTSKEYTCYYARILDQHLAQTVELLADLVQNPSFDAEEIERERQVVLEEIRMVDDTPDDVIHDMFAAEFYPGQTLGRPIQGTVESVGALTVRQIRRFFEDVYRPENMLVVAAGNVNHAGLVRQVKRAFGRLRRGLRQANGNRPPRARAHVCRKQRADLGQLHLLLGVEAFRGDSAGRYALHMYNAILGGTMSSRLFQRIREERGLAYSIYSSLNGFSDAGHLMIYGATNPAAGREMIRLAIQELRDLRDAGPTRDELEVAREHLKGSLMLSLESSSGRMSSLARQAIFSRRSRTLSETLAALNKITRGQVHRVAREVAASGRLSLAAVGPQKQLRLGRETLEL